MRRPFLLAAVLLSCAAPAARAQTAAAATPAAAGAQDRSGAAAAAAPIQGVDAMSGKDRSGPDGWSWAPVSRTQGASADAPGEKSSDAHRESQQSKVAGTIDQSLGADPGAPLDTRQPGPAGVVPSQPGSSAGPGTAVPARK